MSLSPENNDPAMSCEFKENLNIFREIPFFAGLSLEAHKVFAYLCTREAYQAGDYLFRQGDDDGQAFYLLTGNTRITRKTDGDTIDVTTCGPGEFVGSMALMGTQRRLFSMQATADTTSLVLTREKFSRAMQQFPELMPKAIEGLIQRVCLWEERLLTDHMQSCDACRTKAGVSLL